MGESVKRELLHTGKKYRELESDTLSKFDKMIDSKIEKIDKNNTKKNDKNHEK